jgi:phospholipid transport system transporter-binding protein
VSECRITAGTDGKVAVTGPLTFQTVPACLAESRSWIGGSGNALTIDLAGVTLADSAGLALLLEWRQLAEASGRQPAFVNLPEQMRHLIDVSGLAAVFPSG